MKDPQGCGLLVDCPATYTLESVNASASSWDELNVSHAALLASRHAAARAACERPRSRLASGAWCVVAAKAGDAGVRTVRLPGGHDYGILVGRFDYSKQRELLEQRTEPDPRCGLLFCQPLGLF